MCTFQACGVKDSRRSADHPLYAPLPCCRCLLSRPRPCQQCCLFRGGWLQADLLLHPDLARLQPGGREGLPGRRAGPPGTGWSCSDLAEGAQWARLRRQCLLQLPAVCPLETVHPCAAAQLPAVASLPPTRSHPPEEHDARASVECVALTCAQHHCACNPMDAQRHRSRTARSIQGLVLACRAGLKSTHCR